MKRLRDYFSAFFRENVYLFIREYKDLGIKISTNCDIIRNYIDPLFPYLLTMGNDVTITNATILTHDVSIHKYLGYTKLGEVVIGNNVFIGFDTIFLPNTHIGNNVIVGAGCVVSKDISDNSVVVGNPMIIVFTYTDYMKKYELFILLMLQYYHLQEKNCNGMTQQVLFQLL